jgi:DNA modification methylase
MSKVIGITPLVGFDAVVLDPFCGSGTTLSACKSRHIKAIGVDSSEEYCEIAKIRLSQDVLKF